MIELSSVSKTYAMGDAAVNALRNVSLTIERGEFVAIMGPSGSGKSTLMHVLGLLDQPDSGSYRLMGHEISQLTDDELAILRSRTVGFVFQQFHLLARITARENVSLPLLYSSGESDNGRAEKLLGDVGLGDRAQHRPNEMSGGQQQRVAIARALINDPELIFADEPTGNLDSASAVEIMQVLANLHRAGKTIILVTHEAELARYAHRVIQLRDGAVVSDEHRQPIGRESAAPAAAGRSFDLHRRSPFRARGHRALRLTRQALRTITANKVRSGLSMLGILIGVAAVIAMLALGTGAKLAIQQQLASMGSNTLMLFPGSHRPGPVAQQAGAVTRLTLDDARALKRAIPSIVHLSPQVSGRSQVVYGNRNWNTYVLGAGPEYADISSAKPQVGRFFTEKEITERARVAVIGTTIWRELFGGGNAIGAFIRIKRISFQVIGILPEKGGDRFRDQDDVIVIPVTTAMYRLLGRKYVDLMNMQIADASQLESAQTEIRSFMLRRHRLDPDNEDAFQIRNLAEFQAMLTSTSRTMSVLLASIAVISLIVGGIGIMNIMLVSVTERTREIGLRKAVGARRRDILTQFLIEAVVISLTGGVVGILLGVGAATAMSVIAGWTTAVSAQSVVMAFGFSALIGVVFGMWPARKAALLNPIDALRYE
ncbi:MAG: ABC transporter permease [Kiritimatiellae bacterium]|nr:ABC transporter permease [Kiritimatiellia bacterium]